MISVEPSGKLLGAAVRGIDLAAPLSDADFGALVRVLGAYGVLRFPDQRLDGAALRDFAARFGSLQGSVTAQLGEPGLPEVGILSNVVEHGQPIGLADAGQDWHTDMSYNRTIGFLNVLYAVKVPRRGDQVLGATQFSDMGAAYDTLAPDLKERLADATATHDFNKFWEMMRTRPGSQRDPLSVEQRGRRPASAHPLFMSHPITGRKVLYCNPGYAVRINELEPAESDRVLEDLFAHQLQPQFRYVHTWTEGDVLMWDHIRTIHMAVADYGPHEPRLMKRCQVMADRVFDEDFLRSVELASPN